MQKFIRLRHFGFCNDPNKSMNVVHSSNEKKLQECTEPTCVQAQIHYNEFRLFIKNQQDVSGKLLSVIFNKIIE